MSASSQSAKETPPAFELPKEPAIMMFVGKQRSGKSYAIRSLMCEFQKHQPFAFGITYCKTAFNAGYDYMPEKSVKDNFTTDRLKKWIETLRIKAKALAQQGKKLPRNYVILDDLMAITNWYDPWMINWTSTFRHTNTWVFVTAQHLAQGSSTNFRECTNLAFMWGVTAMDSYEKLFSNFGQMMPGQKKSERFANFQSVLKQVTQAEDEEHKHQCLLFMSDRSSARQTYVAWKASPVDESFKVVFSK